MAKKGNQPKSSNKNSKSTHTKSHIKPQEPQAPKAQTDDRDIGQYSGAGVPPLMKK
jgi:hypothetical protein